MPKRSRKPPRDIAQAARSILDQVTGEAEKVKAPDPLAVELGRRGGLKGGKARAEKLTPKQRKESAKKAAEARWSRRKQ